MCHVSRLICGTVAIACACAHTTLCPPRLQAADRDDIVIATFDVARNGDVLLLPIAIGDRQYQFMVDTADAHTWVDVTLQSQLESVEKTSSIGGKAYPAYRFAATLDGESHVPVTDDEAACKDFSRIRAVYGHDIRGGLGMNLLKRHVIQVDFDARRLSLLKAVSEADGREFRLIYNKRDQPMLDIELDEGETTAFVVSSASSRGCISLNRFRTDNLIEKGRFESRAPPSWFWTGETDKLNRRGRLDRFSLGEFQHEQVTVREASENTIGLSLLSRYVVTFDFPHSRLYLKKGKRFAEPHRCDLSGLELIKVDGETRIEDVRPQTPADAVGLQAKDQILNVDGKNASSLSLFELRSLLMQEGARVKLVVTGSPGRRQVEMQLPAQAIPAPAEPVAAASAIDDEAARDSSSIVFEGAVSFDAGQIKRRLSRDIDFQLACHPANPWPNYLKQLEEIVVVGYRTGGFAKVRAEARFDAQRRQVVVQVQEGPRYRCSRVQVSGLDARESAALVSELTQEVPAAFAIPIVIEREDGTTRTVYETVEGKEAEPAKPVWKVGEPASFDKSLAADVGKRLMHWFWARGRMLAVYHIEVKIEDGSDAAILVIEVDDPGVPVTVGDIEIEGAKLNSAQDVLDLLAISPGMPFDAHTELQLDRRLWASGRLIRGYIRKAAPVRTPDGARVNLTVVISEHPKAAPLHTPLTPGEKALLKLRDWVVRWSEGVHDEELVIDLKLNLSNLDDHAEVNSNPETPEKIFKMHVVTSPRDGQVISAWIKQEGKDVFAQTFIARDLRTVMHSSLTGTHLELRNCA